MSRYIDKVELYEYLNTLAGIAHMTGNKERLTLLIELKQALDTRSFDAKEEAV